MCTAIESGPQWIATSFHKQNRETEELIEKIVMQLNCQYFNQGWVIYVCIKPAIHMDEYNGIYDYLNGC